MNDLFKIVVQKFVSVLRSGQNDTIERLGWYARFTVDKIWNLIKYLSEGPDSERKLQFFNSFLFFLALDRDLDRSNEN